MTHRRTPKRRLAATALGLAALLAGSVAAAQANAAPGASPTSAPRTLSSAQAGDLADDLTARLGAAAAGAYYAAETETLIVNVVDEAAVPEVESAGAEARVVPHSLAELTETHEAVRAFAVPGTAWSIDPVSNSVRVRVDSTVTGRALEEVRDAVAGLGGTATLERSAGTYQPYLAGGDAIHSGGARCSLGFNVTLADGGAGFLTAGHCGEAGSQWSETAGGPPVASLTRSEFPGSDWALAQYTADVPHPSAVSLYDGTTQEITGAAEATVGQQVTRSGSTTGVHPGEVTAVDVSVTYPQGTVDGVIETTVCAEPGDSGGALFSGPSAIGLTSGGSGDCTVGGTTFFFPVTDALAASGATLP
ncbi:S1 family peptidase [Streptomyces sp. DSM 44917]|uniref:S1 family peptidase n=1 Tax=Streptomyces boetiae TaxID=3075541 RepID=A0ABU2LGM8_9ACTN|nr:S1 family peptidase [Streptomyces sp. DSM 44917]MDT0310402.1 S1 family peptidase [Streptomyces sp. DSM 44917]